MPDAAGTVSIVASGARRRGRRPRRPGDAARSSIRSASWPAQCQRPACDIARTNSSSDGAWRAMARAARRLPTSASEASGRPSWVRMVSTPVAHRGGCEQPYLNPTAELAAPRVSGGAGIAVAHPDLGIPSTSIVSSPSLPPGTERAFRCRRSLDGAFDAEGDVGDDRAARSGARPCRSPRGDLSRRPARRVR